MPAPAVTPRRGRALGPIPRRPALPAALLFIAGIFVHGTLPHVPVLWCAAAIACLLAALIVFHRDYACSALIAIALACVGAAIAQVEAFQYPSNHISAYATDEPRLAQMEMRIDDEPRVLTDPFGQRPMPPKQVAMARVTRVLTWNGWANASGEMLVQIAQPHPRLALGQHVRVIGLLERPAPAMNPGQFDWAGYYREQRVLNSVHIPQADNIHILWQDPIGPIDLLRRETRRLLAAGFTFEQSLDHALLRALLLGDADPELRDVQEQFKRTGTSHHISVSGMHVAVLSGFIYGICRLLRMRPRFSAVITLAFAVLYGLVALPAPPILRSIILCVAVGVGVLSRRAIDVIQLLAISVMALLIVHPLDLFNAGFQLSFGTVLALMLFTRPFTRWVRSLRGEDFDSPSSITGSTTAGLFRRSGAWCEQKFTDAFAAALVAWFVSMPLVWFHFSQFKGCVAFLSVLPRTGRSKELCRCRPC